MCSWQFFVSNIGYNIIIFYRYLYYNDKKNPYDVLCGCVGHKRPISWAISLSAAQEIDSSKLWEIPKKENLLKIMKNTWKIDPSILWEKRKSTFQRNVFFCLLYNESGVHILLINLLAHYHNEYSSNIYFYFIYNFQ